MKSDDRQPTPQQQNNVDVYLAARFCSLFLLFSQLSAPNLYLLKLTVKDTYG